MERLARLSDRATHIARGPVKATTLSGAIRRHVKPGSHVHLTSGLNRPQASVYEVLRAFRGRRMRLTLSCMSLAGPYVLLVTEGLVSKAICAFHGDTLPTPGPNPMLQQAYAEGRFELSSWSILSFTQRLLAGALQLPWMPTNSLAGSSLVHDPDVLTAGAAVAYRGEGPGPESDGVTAVRALVPDVALVHAPAADRYGNVLLGAPFGDHCLGAWAATQGAIVTVERIVDPEVVAAHSSQMRLPAEIVLAVCEAPFGAHPGPLFAGGVSDVVEPYAEDVEFVTAFRKACRDPQAIDEWQHTWVDDGHAAYLSALGTDRLARLRGRAQLGSWRDDILTSGSVFRADEARDTERAVIAGARVLCERVRERGLETVLAGVGLSNLSAWLARTKLAADGIPVQLMVELGMYGYVPAPGDPLLVSNRAAATATGLGGVMDILGLGLARTASAGIIGAGQVDRHGHVNSSRTASGKLLVGSGGSNDVASLCRDVVVVCTQSRQRFVRDVAYVTAPGSRVGSVATQHGVLTKDPSSGELVLTHVWGPVKEGVREATANCGWELRAARRVERLAEPTRTELELVRGWDPSELYLG